MTIHEQLHPQKYLLWIAHQMAKPYVVHIHRNYHYEKDIQQAGTRVTIKQVPPDI